MTVFGKQHSNIRQARETMVLLMRIVRIILEGLCPKRLNKARPKVAAVVLGRAGTTALGMTALGRGHLAGTGGQNRTIGNWRCSRK